MEQPVEISADDLLLMERTLALVGTAAMVAETDDQSDLLREYRAFMRSWPEVARAHPDNYLIQAIGTTPYDARNMGRQPTSEKLVLPYDLDRDRHTLIEDTEAACRELTRRLYQFAPAREGLEFRHVLLSVAARITDRHPDSLWQRITNQPRSSREDKTLRRLAHALDLGYLTEADDDDDDDD